MTLQHTSATAHRMSAVNLFCVVASTREEACHNLVPSYMLPAQYAKADFDQPSTRSAYVMQAVCGTQQVPYQGQTLDLGQPFRRATMHELVQEALGERSCQAKLNIVNSLNTAAHVS